MQEYRIWKGDVLKRWFLETRTTWAGRPWDLVATFETYVEALNYKQHLKEISN